MAYKIDASLCSGCAACEFECPNKAIREKDGVYHVRTEKCTECVSYFDEPQCVAVCPISGAVVIDTAVPRYAGAQVCEPESVDSLSDRGAP